MTPRLYRRTSSKENRARPCEAFGPVGSRALMRSPGVLRAAYQQQFPQQ